MAAKVLPYLALAAVCKATESLTLIKDRNDEAVTSTDVSDVLRSSRDPKNDVDDQSKTSVVILEEKASSSSGEFPVYITVVIAILAFVMMTTFLYYLCRCLIRKRKREDQLSTLTPKTFDPRMAGVRANQPIEFVVPTTVVVSETTEDSISETDYSSSGCKNLPFLVDRKRKRAGNFQIKPEDLQHGLYEVVAPVPRKGGFLGDLGKVGFVLRYNLQRSQLTVKIIGARDLPFHFTRTAVSPCVKVVLLPEKTTKYVTKVVKNTSHPVFNEIFTFCVRREELAQKRLKLSVWDYDKFSRKCLIGQVVYDIKDSGLTSSLSVDATSGEIWVDLKQDVAATHPNENGKILLSLCYDPDRPTLTLTVLKVKGLDMRQDKSKDTAVYAKVALYVRKKLIRTKKTPSRKKAPEVEFNTPFDIHVPRNALKEVDLMVTLCEKCTLGGKRILGRTQAGPNCLCEQGLQHWQDMLSSLKSTCAQWHALCT